MGLSYSDRGRRRWGKKRRPWERHRGEGELHHGGACVSLGRRKEDLGARAAGRGEEGGEEGGEKGDCLPPVPEAARERFHPDTRKEGRLTASFPYFEAEQGGRKRKQGEAASPIRGKKKRKIAISLLPAGCEEEGPGVMRRGGSPLIDIISYARGKRRRREAREWRREKRKKVQERRRT